jgi:NAD(P)-dependent dehydrogenase (short-subunit alcohol dehydrogenase family)
MKRIVITGAASGLGLAMAKKYASEGWAVCVADIQDEEGRNIASQLKALTLYRAINLLLYAYIGIYTANIFAQPNYEDKN